MRAVAPTTPPRYCDGRSMGRAYALRSWSGLPAYQADQEASGARMPSSAFGGHGWFDAGRGTRLLLSVRFGSRGGLALRALGRRPRQRLVAGAAGRVVAVAEGKHHRRGAGDGGLHGADDGLRLAGVAPAGGRWGAHAAS